MGTYPTQPTFPIDVSTDPGSGILIARQGASLKLRLDPENGGSGGSGGVSAVAVSACGTHRALRSAPGGVSHYSASDPLQFGAYVGISLAVASVGQPIAYQESGPIDDPSWTWTPGLPIYAGIDGALTQQEPATGVCQVVGAAASATRLLIDRSPPILL